MADGVARASKVLLLGGGHAHVEVIRHLGELGLGSQVTLVSPQRHAPYSGMLPGHIAGDYSFDDFHIDLATLCAQSGVTFLETSATGIDPQARSVLIATGEDFAYDLLSIDIGSTPSLPKGISAGIAVKPIATFTERLAQLDAEAQKGDLRHLAIVGQGVAGVEVAFALKRRFEGRNIQIALVGRSAEPVPDRSRHTRHLLARQMQAHGIAHHPGFDVVAYEDAALVARDGRRVAADEVVWTTSSAAPAFLRQTGLNLDESGFIRVDEMLRSVSHPQIFAAGDVASLPEPRPKAGVFAVRQGPVLAENIHRSLLQKELTPYHPQKAWLVLISLADGRAIADKWGLALSGRWVARWKHRIDTSFMDKYRR